MDTSSPRRCANSEEKPQADKLPVQNSHSVKEPLPESCHRTQSYLEDQMPSLIDPFLIAASAGELLVQYCVGCATGRLPPTMRCDVCGGTLFAWRAATGRGSLASFTILHRAPPEHRDRIPYVYALVDLAEGPRMISNVVVSEMSELRIGMPLEVVFQRQDHTGQYWPEFIPTHSDI